MDLQQIKNFLKLSEELHYWNTANKTNITQSALSRQIQAMETELNLKLFERSKRKVKLTAAGEFLRDKYAGLMDEFKFVHQFAKKIDLGELGTIRIAHPDSISFSILPKILDSIANRFPNLQVELTQLLYENEQQFLKEYKIDLAFTRDINRLNNVSSKKIQTDSLSLVLPVNHPIRHFDDIEKSKLQLEKFILPMDDTQSSYNEIINLVFDFLGFVPQNYYRSDFGSTIMGLVTNNLGIAILPSSFLRHASPGIHFVELPIKTDLYISWRSDDNNPVLTNIIAIIESLMADD